jgi:hypothetical protein
MEDTFALAIRRVAPHITCIVGTVLVGAQRPRDTRRSRLQHWENDRGSQFPAAPAPVSVDRPAAGIGDMSPAESAGEPRLNPRRPRSMAFRKRSSPLPTPEQSRRQSDVVQSAWRHFGQPGPSSPSSTPATTLCRASRSISPSKAMPGWSVYRSCSAILHEKPDRRSMRKRRDPGSDERRADRVKKDADGRRHDASAEEKAMDAAVKRSIKLHGA